MTDFNDITTGSQQQSAFFDDVARDDQRYSAAESIGRRRTQEDAMGLVGLKIENPADYFLHHYQQMIAANKDKVAGTTAAMYYFDPEKKKITTANLGDSRVYITIKNPNEAAGPQYKTILLTEDHNPNLPRIKTEVESKGGLVMNFGGWRVDGALAVGAAIGDKNYPLKTEPDVVTFDIDELCKIAFPDQNPANFEFVVTNACDGLTDHQRDQNADFVVERDDSGWKCNAADGVHEESLSNLIARHQSGAKEQSLAHFLNDDAYKFSRDNISVSTLSFKYSEMSEQAIASTLGMVFDGHGGSETSQSCIDYIRENYRKHARSQLAPTGDTIDTQPLARPGTAQAVSATNGLAIIRDVFSSKLRLSDLEYEGGAESFPEKTPADFLNVSVEEEGGVKKIKIRCNPEVDEAISKAYIAQIKAAMLDRGPGLLRSHSTSEADISGSRAEASLEFNVNDVNVEQLQANDLGYFADVIYVLKGGGFEPSQDTIDNLKRLAVRLHEIRSFFQDRHGKATKFTKDEMPQDLLFDLVKNFIPGFNEGAVVKTKILDQKGADYSGPIKEEDKHCYIAFNLAGDPIADPNYPPPYTVFIDPYDLEFSLTPGSHLRGYDEKFRGVSHHLIAQDATDLSRSSLVGRVFDGFYIDADNQQAIHDEIKSVIAIEESLELAQTAQERFTAPEYTLTEDSVASLQKIMSRQKVRNPDSGFQSLYSKKGDDSFEEDLDQLISVDGTKLVSICSPQGFEDNQDGGVIALSIAAMVNPLPEVVRSNNSDGRPLFDIDGEVEFQRILIPLNKGVVHWDLLCIDVDRREGSKKLTFSNIATDGIRYPAPQSIVDSVTIDGYEKENFSRSEDYYQVGAQLGQNCGIATALMMQDQMSEFLTDREERSYNGFLNTFEQLQGQLIELKRQVVTSANGVNDKLEDYAKAIIEDRKGVGTASEDEIKEYISDRYTENIFANTADAIKFITSNKDEFKEIGFDFTEQTLNEEGIDNLRKMILKHDLVQALYAPEEFAIIQDYDITVRGAVYEMASDQGNLGEGDFEDLANDIEKIAGNFDGRARGEIGTRSSVQQIYNKHLNRLSEDRLYQRFITEFSGLDHDDRQTVYDVMSQCRNCADDRRKIVALKKLPVGGMQDLLFTPADELKKYGRVNILDIFESHIVPFLGEWGLSVTEPEPSRVPTDARHQDQVKRRWEGENIKSLKDFLRKIKDLPIDDGHDLGFEGVDVKVFNEGSQGPDHGKVIKIKGRENIFYQYEIHEGYFTNRGTHEDRKAAESFLDMENSLLQDKLDLLESNLVTKFSRTGEVLVQDAVLDAQGIVDAIRAEQQAEAQERAKQEAAERLSDLNSYLQSSSSTDGQYDSSPDILTLKAEIKKNQDNPKPKTPYRGAGIKSDLVQYDNGQYALQITDIFPPSGSRFSKKASEGVEEIFSAPQTFTDEGIIGGKITEVFVGGSYKSITDIVNESGTVELALQRIAKIFHDPNSVKFKVESAGGDEVAAGSVIEIICGNSRNSKSIFAPSASATSDFKAINSMTDEEKLEILNDLSTSRGAPGSSPRGVTTKGAVLNATTVEAK